MDLAGQLDAAQLRALTDNPKSQHSIRPINLTKLWRAIGDPRATPFEAALEQQIPGGHATRVVRVRKGQPEFRKALREQFGDVCAFTGPCPERALEAAHLYSFAASGKHHRHGGWLMRRDLHSLFDVGHVAVHPVDLVVDLTAEVRGYASYAGLHGRPVEVAVEEQHREWLDLHWSRNR
ncbi:hypothetical protein GCM10023148_42830 [Actinokineospora soli]